MAKKSSKKFAALAPPYNKATAADRIAGAKGAKPKLKDGGGVKSKYVDEMGNPTTREKKEQYEKSMNDYLNATRNRKPPVKVSTVAKSNPGNVAANTSVAKNYRAKTEMVEGEVIPKKKMGGSCGTPKKLSKRK